MAQRVIRNLGRLLDTRDVPLSDGDALVRDGSGWAGRRVVAPIRFDQPEASAQWQFAHGLSDPTPPVGVYLSGGIPVAVVPTYPGQGTVRIDFPEPVAGYVLVWMI